MTGESTRLGESVTAGDSKGAGESETAGETEKTGETLSFEITAVIARRFPTTKRLSITFTALVF